MEYKRIFQSQRSFFQSHRTKDISFRKEALIKLKKLLQENESRLYEAIYADFRKSEFDTFLTELTMIYKEIDFFVKNLKKLSKPRRAKTPLVLQPGKSRIYYDPLGVTLIIGAWNYPYQLTLVPLISAMAAGNTCIVKPSELPENTMNLLAELLNTNFPQNYIYVATGGIPETTELLQLPYDKIFFTGSPKVGKVVYEAAAKNLVPVVLELGGKSPGIVTKSANLEIAAKRLIWGKFLNSGQTCIAPDYLLVEESVKPKLLELMKKQLEEINYADGAPHYTSIINQRNFERILDLIEQDKLYYGGGHNAETRYIQPTILDGVVWEDPVMEEEIFGPVLPVLTYKVFDGAIQDVLEGEKPLAAYLFSNDKDEKKKFQTLLSFGGGCINDTIMHVASEHLPFGGVGNSGLGNYHGESGFLAFSHQKSIVEKANWGEPNFKYPPYSEKKLSWIKRLL